jgi:hypothetical protein
MVCATSDCKFIKELQFENGETEESFQTICKYGDFTDRCMGFKEEGIKNDGFFVSTVSNDSGVILKRKDSTGGKKSSKSKKMRKSRRKRRTRRRS